MTLERKRNVVLTENEPGNEIYRGTLIAVVISVILAKRRANDGRRNFFALKPQIMRGDIMKK